MKPDFQPSVCACFGACGITSDSRTVPPTSAISTPLYSKFARQTSKPKIKTCLSSAPKPRLISRATWKPMLFLTVAVTSLSNKPLDTRYRLGSRTVNSLLKVYSMLTIASFPATSIFGSPSSGGGLSSTSLGKSRMTWVFGSISTCLRSKNLEYLGHQWDYPPFPCPIFL
ncbi:hypothetical protein SISNIDRAFT_159322 [Sistotremastrum niveocremeum HHB9708]|uniref:Uncharacterized protein n=1 Tax=Sistotremastrum niveocremeum HHB9708 TaxID=1314777 RepID=A0A164SUE1_9AGAM|nr:hypothetical protein SISNIDRAFT_159322 [Sistotremastrum niveocremeum HHB9708]